MRLAARRPSLTRRHRQGRSAGPGRRGLRFGAPPNCRPCPVRESGPVLAAGPFWRESASLGASESCYRAFCRKGLPGEGSRAPLFRDRTGFRGQNRAVRVRAPHAVRRRSEVLRQQVGFACPRSQGRMASIREPAEKSDSPGCARKRPFRTRWAFPASVGIARLQGGSATSATWGSACRRAVGLARSQRPPAGRRPRSRVRRPHRVRVRVERCQGA